MDTISGVDGEHFRLRYLQSGDAAGLFACYHDKEAVRFMNADNYRRVLCGNTGGDTEHGGLVAEGGPGLSAADDSSSAGGSACGHGGGLRRKDGGLLLLRVDIAAAYETGRRCAKILGLCIDGMFALFPSHRNVGQRRFRKLCSASRR